MQEPDEPAVGAARWAFPQSGGTCLPHFRRLPVKLLEAMRDIKNYSLPTDPETK